MPYVAIKAYPKDDETKKKLVERINDVFLEVWGCPPEAISISLEEVAPSDWEEKVQKPEVDANKDKMMIYSGKKNF